MHFGESCLLITPRKTTLIANIGGKGVDCGEGFYYHYKLSIGDSLSQKPDKDYEACERESRVVALKSFKGVTDKWQAPFQCVITSLPFFCSGRCCSPQVNNTISLINFINRKVGCVNVRCELWLERCTDLMKAMKVDSMEESVILYLVRTSATKAIFRVADKAKCRN
jgi:hypothetical protein